MKDATAAMLLLFFITIQKQALSGSPNQVARPAAPFFPPTWLSCVAPPRVDVGLPASRFRSIDLIDLCGDQGVRRHCHFKVQPGN
jgi:hypothetical protein